MPLISDDQWRDFMCELKEGSGLSLDEIAKEMGLTKGRISQVLSKEKPTPIPIGFPARFHAAVQRIIARRAAAVGLQVLSPKDNEPQ